MARQAAVKGRNGHKAATDKPAIVRGAQSADDRTSGASEAVNEQHRCSDIRSFLSSQPKQGKLTTAATSAANAKEQQAKRAKTDVDTAAGLSSLRTLCWNVMGLTTVQDELVRMVNEHKPDVIVLTETKLRRQGKNRQRLAQALPEYELYASCKPDSDNPRTGERWAAGVAMAVHKSLTRYASATHRLLNVPAASGHCQWVTLQLAGSDALQLWAVYMPHDMALRQQVYQVLRDNISTDSATRLAGDWNAAYIAADRASGHLSAADKAHQQLLTDLHLSPSDDGMDSRSREHTFYSKANVGQHSRIDDQIISNTLKTGRKPTTAVLKKITDDSDHYPVRHPIGGYHFQRPRPDLAAPDRTATLKLPLTKEQQENYKTRTEMRIGMAARQLAAEVNEDIKQANEAMEEITAAQRLRCSKGIQVLSTARKVYTCHSAANMQLSP